MTDMAQRTAALLREPSRDDAGDPHRLARVERTRAEMMRQGDAVAATLAREDEAIDALARALRGRAVRHVVVAGCGDSFHVGLGVRHAFERLLGVTFEAAQALDYAAYGAGSADETTLVIGISAGGDTPAVLAALDRARRRGALTVGLSGRAGSRVLAESDAAFVIHATRAGWPTQSSTAAMALLIRLAGRWAGDPAADAALAGVPALVDRLAQDLDATMAAVARGIAAAPLVLFAGLGPNLAAAAFGAAKVRELCPIHAFAIPLEEYHHYRSQKAGDPLILVATDAASRERALDTALVSRKVGGHTVAVLAAPDPDIEAHVEGVVRLPAVDPLLGGLVPAIPLHLMAYHLARARDALGLGAPPRLAAP